MADKELIVLVGTAGDTFGLTRGNAGLYLLESFVHNETKTRVVIDTKALMLLHAALGEELESLYKEKFQLQPPASLVNDLVQGETIADMTTNQSVHIIVGDSQFSATGSTEFVGQVYDKFVVLMENNRPHAKNKFRLNEDEPK